MKLIVGLGNPGKEYAGTRHNIGFEAVDRLAVRFGWTRIAAEFDRIARSRFDGLAIDGIASGQRLTLLKPATFMNLSGRAVRAAAGFYQVSPADVLVVLDDVALPCGKLRIRASGSSGGHNGLKDIERMLGTDAYPRLRIGIDPRPPRMDQRDYVLGRFDPAQRTKIDAALDRVVDAAGMWLTDGVERAMNRFNVADDEKAPPPG